MKDDKIADQAHYVLMAAESLQQFPNKIDDLEFWCEALAESMEKTHPINFITVEQPYLIAEALIYALSRRLVKGDDAIVIIYYLLVKSTRNKTYPASCITVANMLAFAFLDEHKEIIGNSLIKNNLQQFNIKNIDETIYSQIMGQLSVLYWSFEKLNYEDYINDLSLMNWVDKAVGKYLNIFDGYDQAKKQTTANFINENISIMLKNIEFYWEDISERELL